jgi:hypothetical protein
MKSNPAGYGAVAPFETTGEGIAGPIEPEGRIDGLGDAAHKIGSGFGNGGADANGARTRRNRQGDSTRLCRDAAQGQVPEMRAPCRRASRRPLGLDIRFVVSNLTVGKALALRQLLLRARPG